MCPRLEAVVYAGSRFMGAIVSISVFALVARKLPSGDAEGVFFLLFTLGFAVALLRSYCMLGANLVGGLRRTERLRRIAASAQNYGRLMPIAVLVLSLVFSFQALPWWACPLVAAMVCAAGYDSDLTRAIFNRATLYPWLVLCGGLASLAVLLALDEIDVGDAVLAILLGWAPACILGASRWAAESRLARRHSVRPRAVPSVRALLVASLDGVVLNAPFLGGANFSLGGTRGYDLAIAMRVFSSSQPLFPLIAHWGNSGRLWKLGQRLCLTEATLYGLLLVSTGVIASLLFVVMFGYISDQIVTGGQYAMFVFLLFGYCAYSSQARFGAMSISPRGALLIYAMAITFFLAGMILVRASGAPTWTVAMLQGGTLFLAGSAIRALTRRAKPQDEAVAKA